MTLIVNLVYLYGHKSSQLSLLINKFQLKICFSPFRRKTTMATEQKSIIRKLLPPVIGLIVLGSAGFYGFQSYRHNQTYETTDNAQIESKSAPVLARVAGYIQVSNVEDYKSVNANERLIEIDPQEYAIAVSQAEADYQQSLADLETAKASLRNIQENYKVAQANANVQLSRKTKAATDLQRDKNLYEGGSATKKVFEESQSNVEIQDRQYDATLAQVNQAKVSEGSALANIKKMEAILKVKQTVLDQAKLRLSYTHIDAPVSGKTGKINVAKGQYVQPGQNLFTIINDSNFWITANFKETQLEKMRVGQPVEIKIDAFPNLKITGKITTISDATGAKFSLLPADNASGNFVKLVQRIPVKIEIDNPQQYKDLLRAGLSTEVAVKVK